MTESLNIEPAEDGTLAVAASLPSDSALQLELRGSAYQRDTDFLDNLLDDVHAEATRLEVGEVIVDFRELEFMNSMAFKSFVRWIVQVTQLDEDAKYRVRLLGSEDMHWQRRSLEALRCFAADLIEVVG